MRPKAKKSVSAHALYKAIFILITFPTDHYSNQVFSHWIISFAQQQFPKTSLPQNTMRLLTFHYVKQIQGTPWDALNCVPQWLEAVAASCEGDLTDGRKWCLSPREQKTQFQEHIYTARWPSFPDLPPREHFITSLRPRCTFLSPVVHAYAQRQEKALVPESLHLPESTRAARPGAVCHAPWSPAVPGQECCFQSNCTLCLTDAAGREPHMNMCKPSHAPVRGHT